MVVEVQA